MKKNRKEHNMFKKFKQYSLNSQEKQTLKGGDCGCGPDDGGSTPPKKEKKSSSARFVDWEG
jgi:hypothetical protein